MVDQKSKPAPKESDKSARELELEAQLEKAESAKLDAEKNAVSKVCEAVGIDPLSLEAKKRDDHSQDKMEYDIGEQVVKINGFPYTGRGKAPREVVEVIVSLAGESKMRKLKEKIGNDYEVMQLASGTISSRLLGQSKDSIA